MTPVRQAPRFLASPAPTEEEAAAIAAALYWLAEQEAPVVTAPLSEARVATWVADARARSSRRGVWDYRHRLDRGWVWRLPGRSGVWGAPTVTR